MAQRFGRAGGNWNAAGTWSATSGGASDGSGLNAGDDVVLDSNSTGTFTITASISIATLDCSGLATGASGSPFAGTVSHNGPVTLTVTGLTFKLSSGMTYTVGNATTSILTFAGTSGTTAITPATKTLPTLVCSGSGGTFQLQGDATFGTTGNSTVTFTAGTFDGNGHAFTTPGNVAINGGTILMGGGAWNVNGVSANAWNYTSGTITAGGSALNFTGTQTAAIRTFVLGAQTYGAITISNGGATGAAAGSQNQFTGAATCAALTLTGPLLARFTNGTTLTVTGALTANGGVTSPVEIYSDSATGAQATLACGSTNISGAMIANMAFTGSGLTANNSLSIGNNSGITINPPSGAHIIGG